VVRCGGVGVAVVGGVGVGGAALSVVGEEVAGEVMTVKGV